MKLILWPYLGSVVIVAIFLFITFMSFYLSDVLAKKPPLISQLPIENISPDDALNNHDHERKRLVSWMHHRSRDRFIAETCNLDSKVAPFLLGVASQLHERSSLVPHIKSPPQVFTSTLHSTPRSTPTSNLNPRYFTPIPPILNTVPQLPIIPSSTFKPISTVWKSNANTLSPPPSAKVNTLTRSESATTMERIGTYIQGSSVRDSLDLEVHWARGRTTATGDCF